MKNILFVSGVGRSGTSALVQILNSHHDILMGQERFFYTIRKNLITPAHFEKDRFLNVLIEDTHNRKAFLGTPDMLSRKFDRSQYIGDKFPSLFRHFDRIFTDFPEARHLYIVRNPLSVIESYDVRNRNPEDSWNLTWKDGMDAWNESVGKVASLSSEQLERFVVVQYEKLFRSPDAINRMFKDLGLVALEDKTLLPFVQKFASLNEKLVPRRDDLRDHVARHSDWDSFRKLCRLIEHRRDESA